MWRHILNIIFFEKQWLLGMGLAFRQQNDRCYYFLGVDNDHIVLMRVQHEVAFQVPGEHVLYSLPFERKPHQEIRFELKVLGNTMDATVNGMTLSATDTISQNGCIALFANASAQFDKVQVSCTSKALRNVQLEKGDGFGRRVVRLPAFRMTATIGRRFPFLLKFPKAK
ncbi:MAG: hypothetical protein ACK56W_22870 [Pirellula sp.]|nr:hypothetical protein [Pirellula sp.]